MPSPAPELEVVYEDNHLLAANKPPGLPTQPSGRGGPNLEDWAKAWVKAVHGKPGNVYLHAVHRLDRVVSGLVLFARTEKALSRLNAQTRERRMVKVYHAVVQPAPPEAAGTLRHGLRHERFRATVSDAADPRAKEAVLDYKVLQRAGERALLEVRLGTGRYHQIRAQLAAAGMPIVGDVRYGGTGRLPGGVIALHHRRLELEHPVRHTPLVVEAPYPEVTKELFVTLRV